MCPYRWLFWVSMKEMGMRKIRRNVIVLKLLSESKKKTKNPITMHSELQGDNYFLLPSSVTLPAAPSLETLHGTHRSKTKHERMAKWECEAKRIWCLSYKWNKPKKKKTDNAYSVYTKCGECRKVGVTMRNPGCFCVYVKCGEVTWHACCCV